MQYVAIVFAFIIGFGGCWFLRFRKREASYVLLLTEQGQEIVPCKRVPKGVEADGVFYASTLYRSHQLAGGSLYVVGAEAVPLLRHQALEQARRGVVFSALFEPGGDMFRYVQYAAVAVPLVVMIVFYFSIGSIQSGLAQNAADMKFVKTVLEKPLQVQQVQNAAK